MTANLKVNRLSKHYLSENAQHFHALDNINFQVEDGAFVSILGPSGCGKTTLLRTIAGLERPTAGQVVLNGRTVQKPGPETGVVFQEHRLFPWLNVRENVTYGLARQGMNRKQRHKIGHEYLSMVGLEDFENNLPKELSIGMSQRVGIARALATDPALLLMDEPFASVDAQTRRDLQRELLAIWRQTGKTILFVTHDINEAILLSQRIIVLAAKPGRIRRVIDVDLPHPRNETDAAFNAIKQELFDLLLH